MFFTKVFKEKTNEIKSYEDLGRVLSESWAGLGWILGGFCGPFGVKMRPRGVPEGSKRVQDGLKRIEKGSKRRSYGFKTVARGVSWAQHNAQKGPRWQEGRRLPKVSPRGPERVSKGWVLTL